MNFHSVNVGTPDLKSVVQLLLRVTSFTHLPEDLGLLLLRFLNLMKWAMPLLNIVA